MLLSDPECRQQSDNEISKMYKIDRGTLRKYRRKLGAELDTIKYKKNGKTCQMNKKKSPEAKQQEVAPEKKETQPEESIIIASDDKAIVQEKQVSSEDSLSNDAPLDQASTDTPRETSDESDPAEDPITATPGETPSTTPVETTDDVQEASPSEEPVDSHPVDSTEESPLPALLECLLKSFDEIVDREDFNPSPSEKVSEVREILEAWIDEIN